MEKGKLGADLDQEMERLPIIALRGQVIFPKTISNFDAGRPMSIKAVEEAQKKDGKVFLLAQRQIDIEHPNQEDLYEIGTLARIKQVIKLPGGLLRVLVEGEERGRLMELEESNPLSGLIKTLPVKGISDPLKKEAYQRLIEEDLNQYITLSPRLLAGILDPSLILGNLDDFVEMAASYLDLSTEDNMTLLVEQDLEKKLQAFHKILVKEIQLAKIQQSIDYQVKENMDKVQREYFLNEQIKVIRKELNGDEDGGDLVDEYRTRLKEKDLPQEVRDKGLKELKKLQQINPASPEYTVLLNYLDWILDLPWQETSQDNTDLTLAREILNQDHYGLKDVKERILEFIALQLANPSAKGPILCLVGPPGVGKTSIASSIARALNKEYVRMSLGGVRDEAAIRGHRRTYVGALPGQIISLLKKAGTDNPVFLLDEIDKLSSSYQGDPASALLEVLDPEQNNSFSDHYLELPFDLSKVFFITTANSVSTIPGPLKDRMEILHLSGYTPYEKKEIAKRYLVPKLLKNAGLEEKSFKITDAVIDSLIEFYTREAGVRALEKELAKIIRRGLLKMNEEGLEKISVSQRNLSDFAGRGKFLKNPLSQKNEVGLVTGLAWTPVGGVILDVEVTISQGKGKVLLTGKLGDVMKESAMTALTYLMTSLDQDLKDFRYSHDFHIHVPEGAVPKDGPSAGVTITTALYSAILNKPVYRDVAMTGEVTLRGQVLAIGGLKEKLLAAQRAGIKRVFIPKENEKDLLEFDEEVTKPLEIIGVKNVREILDLAVEDAHENK